jgi:hypothetical protein
MNIVIGGTVFRTLVGPRWGPTLAFGQSSFSNIWALRLMWSLGTLKIWYGPYNGISYDIVQCGLELTSGRFRSKSYHVYQCGIHQFMVEIYICTPTVKELCYHNVSACKLMLSLSRICCSHVLYTYLAFILSNWTIFLFIFVYVINV